MQESDTACRKAATGPTGAGIASDPADAVAGGIVGRGCGLKVWKGAAVQAEMMQAGFGPTLAVIDCLYKTQLDGMEDVQTRGIESARQDCSEFRRTSAPAL